MFKAYLHTLSPLRPSPLKHVLAVLRTTIGFTQKEMAAMLGVSTPTIQAIELGKLKLSDRLAEKICYETGVHTDWVLANDVSIPPYRYQNKEFNTAGFAEQFEVYRANLSANDVVDAERANLCFTMIMEGVAELILTAYDNGQLRLCIHKLNAALIELRKAFPVLVNRVPHTKIEFEGSKTVFSYADIADVVRVFRSELAKISKSTPRFVVGRVEGKLSEVQKRLMAKPVSKSHKHLET